MSDFFVGLIVLGIMSAVFYIVLFSFIYYWHLKKISFVIVPAVFTFEFLIMGFFVISLVSIILLYVPILIRASGL